MAKYIHNISGTSKTYQGIEIEDNSFYQIQDTLLVEFQNEVNLLSDLLAGVVRMSSDGIADFSTSSIANHNFLRNEHYEVDAQGRQIIRTAAATKGWTYLGLSIELETSKASSLYCKDESDNAISGISLKFYKADGTEITTQGDLDAYCVKTVLTIAPTYDYELVGGNIHHSTVPTSNVRLWVKGGILELGSNYTKTMINGINLRYLGTDDHIRTDGRASKYMTKTISGVPYQGNQLQMIIKHDAGYKHEIMFVLEYFRA